MSNPRVAELNPTADAALLEVRNLTKYFARQSGMFSSKRGIIAAVEDISFDIRRGETFGLVGESGSGKSTTGRLILRLIEATRGDCLYNGEQIFQVDRQRMRQLRREMQIVFQDPYGAFNPRMTIGQILGEALELRDIHSHSERDAEIRRLLEMVQMPTDISSRFPHEFSGGQRQRLSIARALAVNPKFIVADEPLSALDVSTQAEIVNLLLDLQERLNLTMMFISHDLSVVRVLCDRVAVMFGGRILELAESRHLFANPLQPYTQELLKAVPVPDPVHARERREAQAGTQGQSAAAGDIIAPARVTEGCPFAARCPHTMEICWKQMPPLVDYSSRSGEDAIHLAACHWVDQNVKS